MQDEESWAPDRDAVYTRPSLDTADREAADIEERILGVT